MPVNLNNINRSITPTTPVQGEQGNWFTNAVDTLEKYVDAPFWRLANWVVPGEQAGEKRLRELNEQGVTGLGSWQQAMNETTSGWGKFGYGLANPLYYLPVAGWGAKAGRVIGGTAATLGKAGEVTKAATGLSRISPTLGKTVVTGTGLPYAGEQLLGRAVTAVAKPVVKTLATPLTMVARHIAKPEIDALNQMYKKAGIDYAITREITPEMTHDDIIKVIKTVNFPKPSTQLALRRQLSRVPVVGKASRFLENINNTRTLVQDSLTMDVMAEDILANMRSKNTVNIFNRLNHIGDAKKVWGLTDIPVNNPNARFNALAKNVEFNPIPEGTLVYHGGDLPLNLGRGGNEGISVVTKKELAENFLPPEGGVVSSAILPTNAKILRETSIPSALQSSYINEARKLSSLSINASEAEFNALRKSVLQKQRAIVDYARANGYDAVEFPFESEIRVIKPNVLKASTTTQLPSRYIGDIIEDWTNPLYKFTDQQKAWVQEYHKIINEAKKRAMDNGVDLSQYGDDFWYFRHGLGKIDYNTGEVKFFGKAGKPGGPRVHKTMQEAVEGSGLGIEGGQIYNWNPIDSAQHVDAWINKLIRDEQIKKIVKPWGKTPTQMARLRMGEQYRTALLDAYQASKAYNIVRKLFWKYKDVRIGTNGETVITYSPPTSAVIAERASKLSPKEIALLEEMTGEDLASILGGKVTLFGESTGQMLNKIKVQLEDLKSIKKSALDELKPQYKRYVAEYKSGYADPTTQAIIKTPMFNGRVFPIQVAEAYRVGLGLPTKRAESWISTINKVAGGSKVLRTLIASMDFSAPFIQGLPALGQNPLAWAKATARHYRWFFDKGNFSDWMVRPDNAAAWNEAKQYGLQLGTFEYYAGEKAIEQLGTKVPVIGKQLRTAAQQTLGRGEVAFSAFGDAQRIELWKAMGYRATTPEAKMQLAQSINKMTGFTEMAGVQQAEQLLEQSLIFAPRYMRAGFQLVGDVFSGGLKGQLARESLGHMMAGGLIWYMQACKAMGVEPNLNPRSSKFLSLRIGDQWIGIGGFMTSLARFAGNVYAYEEQVRKGEGLGLAKQEGETTQEWMTRVRMDNPFLKYMYSKAAPFVGVVGEAITGQDYLGQDLESPQAWAKWIADKTIPMAFQPLVQGDIGLAGQAAQIAGLREFPVSAKEKFYDKVQELTGVTWKNLDKSQRRALFIDHPELDDMQAEANKAFAIGVSGRINQEWSDRSEAIETQYDTALQNIANTYEAGGYTGKQFRDAVSAAEKTRRDAYDLLEKDGKFTGIYQAFEDPERVNTDNQFDAALFRYRQLVWDNDELTDENGNYDFAAAERAKAQFNAEWPGMQSQIDQYIQLGRMGEPEAIADLRKARQTMSPYFGIKDHLLAQAGLTKTYEAYGDWVNLHPLSTYEEQKYLKDMLGLTPVLEQISNYQKQIREQNGGQNPYNYYYMKYYS